MIKIIFIIVIVIVLAVFIGYLNVNGLLSEFTNTLTLLPIFLQPFLSIYNVVVSFPNTMIFVMAFLGAQIIRYILHKLGVYGND